MIKDDINKVKIEDMTLYSFDMLANATNKFHWASKLGQGGFGPVYRVMSLDAALCVLTNEQNME